MASHLIGTKLVKVYVIDVFYIPTEDKFVHVGKGKLSWKPF